MATWSEVASLDDLPPGSAREFVRDGRVYALFRAGDRVTCLAGACPHQGGRLALGPVAGDRVTCPRRGCLRWSFDLATGEGPARVASYPVRVDGRAVLVALPGG